MNKTQTWRIVFLLLGSLSSSSVLVAQESIFTDSNSIWKASDTLNKARFNFASITSISSYGVASIGLYNSWYKKNKLTKFHFFNDGKEWEGIDKFGHIYSAYVESVLAYKSSKWAGVSDRRSIWTGVITASIVQTTIEIMDGFSDKWGFSLADMGMNTFGIIGFASQQHYWNEQRISFKVSSYTRKYSNDILTSVDGQLMSSIENRANNLFGDSFLERYLKDYNAQTYWASINISSFLPEENHIPKYINIALGYGAENMFGGYENKWVEDNHSFILNDSDYERYHQFYIGLDIDLTRIRTNNYFLKTIFSTFNMFKIPAPAIEFNTKGEVIFHLLKI